jgi:hypothetical protein
MGRDDEVGRYAKVSRVKVIIVQHAPCEGALSQPYGKVIHEWQRSNNNVFTRGPCNHSPDYVPVTCKRLEGVVAQ